MVISHTWLTTTQDSLHKSSLIMIVAESLPCVNYIYEFHPWPFWHYGHWCIMNSIHGHFGIMGVLWIPSIWWPFGGSFFFFFFFFF
jgi:hypothetical protein